MAQLSSSSFWINTCKQLLHLLAEPLLWYSNPSCVLRTPLDERMKWEYLLPDLENKAPSKEEEVRWRGVKRKRWFNFHCHTKIFKAMAGGNRKPLRSGGEWRKQACSIFTTHFIRAQRDVGGRKAEQRCPCSSSASGSSLLLIVAEWAQSRSARSPVTCPAPRVLGEELLISCHHAVSNQASSHPFLYFPFFCTFPLLPVSDGAPDIQLESFFCLFVFRQNTNKYKHLGWDVCLCVRNTY